MRTDGRPALYTNEQLLNVLKDYQKNHPNQKIKYAQLEKATGIKVHIWKYQMRDTIEAINKKIAGANIPARIGYNLPSVEDMLIDIENEPAMQKYYLQTLLDMVNNLYQYKEANKSIDILNADHKEEVDTLKMENEELKKLLDNQQDVINRYILSSASKQKREQEGIKENIIQLDAESLKRYDEMFEALMK